MSPEPSRASMMRVLWSDILKRSPLVILFGLLWRKVYRLDIGPELLTASERAFSSFYIALFFFLLALLAVDRFHYYLHGVKGRAADLEAKEFASQMCSGIRQEIERRKQAGE